MIIKNWLLFNEKCAGPIKVSLGFTTVASATDTATKNESSEPGMTTLRISNEEMNIIKIVKSLRESGLLIESVSETIENEAKEQIGGFLSMLFGTLGASLFRNLINR